MEIDNDLLESGVAKERVAMFKNLQSGAQSTGAGADSKIRVDVSVVSFYLLLRRLFHRSDHMKLRYTFSLSSKSKDFRWHVNVCQPINGSILRRKSQTIVGSFLLFSN